MIRFYVDGSDNHGSLLTASYYLTDRGIVYAVKEANYDQEVGGFFSPTINRWIKGKLTGYPVRFISKNCLATMDTLEEATLVGEGVSGLKAESDEFKMKMCLLADEIVEKPEEPTEYELKGVGSTALAKAMVQSRGPQVRNMHSLGVNYLDDLIQYHGGTKADWREVSRSTKQTIRGQFDFIVLRNDVEKKDVLAKVDARTGDLDNESIIGAVSFGIEDSDGTIVATFGFTPQGGELEIPDQEVEWVFEDHYGIDLSSMLVETCENYFECQSGDDEATVRSFLENLGFVYDSSIEL